MSTTSRLLLLLLLLAGACDRSSSPGAAAKHGDPANPVPDPWTAKPAAEATPDPWTAKPAIEAKPDPWSQPSPPAVESRDEPVPVAPAVPRDPPAREGPPAGTYACQQLNFHANTPATYSATGISFVLDGNGGYDAPSFKGGPGTVTVAGNVMSFHGGAMDGWRGYTGAVASGPFVRIRLKDPTAIATTLSRGDGMCYRKR